MNKKHAFVLSFFLLVFLFVNGQEVRFSFQLGAAIPVGDFALNQSHPDSNGFASTGVDIRFVGERVLENNFVMGVNLGYSMFTMDNEAIKKVINPSNPENVIVETQSFQNISLQARVGYNINLIKDRLGAVPFVDAGLGVFNSAYYAITDGSGNYAVREGNAAMALLVSPGLDIWIPINDFMNLKVYCSYHFANYNVDETFRFTGSNTVEKNATIHYKYNSISTGLGLTMVF